MLRRAWEGEHQVDSEAFLQTVSRSYSSPIRSTVRWNTDVLIAQSHSHATKQPSQRLHNDNVDRIEKDPGDVRRKRMRLSAPTSAEWESASPASTSTFLTDSLIDPIAATPIDSIVARVLPLAATPSIDNHAITKRKREVMDEPGASGDSYGLVA